MRALLLATAALLGPGCKSGLFAADDPYEFTGYTLVFRLDADTVVAGEPVTYTAWLVDQQDQPVEGLTWTMSSNLEDSLEYTTAAIMPRVAGEQAVTVEAHFEGVTYTETESLTVDPGPPFDLDLKLSDLSMQAGGFITWEADVIDAFGNGLGTEDIFVEVDDPFAVTLDGDRLESTLPGTWLVTATYEGLDDVEAFVVVPGPPAGVSLALSTTDLELLQTTSADVSVWDDYGNESDAPWTVWTDRPGDVYVSHRNVTFFAEGWHTVHVTVDGTTLTDQVGPFLIDSTAPWLDITSPPRGTWRTTTTQTVTGTVNDEWSTVADLEINGTPVTPGTGGAFSYNLPLYFGTNVIETVASDGDGNVATDTRAVLQGAFAGYATSSPTGIQVRIQEGWGGIDTLEAIGEGLVTRYDLDDLIPSPVASDSSSTYINPCVFWDCGFWVTWYSYALYVYNPYIGSVDLEMDPRSDGKIGVSFTVWYPSMNWMAGNLTLAEIDFSNEYGSLWANRITVTALATPSVSSNGTISIALSSVDPTIYSLQFDWYNSTLWDILEWFGVDDWIEGLIAGYMENAIKQAVVDEVPPALASALQDLQLTYPISLAGNTYTLTAKPDGVAVDNIGISLSLGTKVTTSSWVHPGYWGLGSLDRNYTPPTWTTGSPKMNIAFSGDFVNQLLYAVWGGGALDIVQTSDALGLPAEDLEVLMPGVSSVTVEAWPMLPPVVVPGVWPYEYELQLGDMEVTLYNGPVANNDVLIQAYVTAYVPLNLTNVGDTRLSASLGTPEIYFDVVVPDASSMAAGDTEALLEALVPLLLPRLTAAIGEIDIPSISGFGISGIGVATGGSYNGYLRLGGSLYEQ